LLFVLAAYIVLGAASSLWTHHGGEFSLPGLIVAAVAMPIMYVLARRKVNVARRLGSRAMRADAIESMTFGWLSLAVVVGLVANLLLGAWWVDAVTSLGIVWFVVKEAREAWSGENCFSHPRFPFAPIARAEFFQKLLSVKKIAPIRPIA
jgi:divalent metal cation (Fe/Co/Zn/Cd) transporter